MSILPKAFFGFLVLIMLTSFAGSWQSISKLHQHNAWPGVYETNQQYQKYYSGGRSWFMALTVNTVIALDSIVGKSLIFASMIGVSFGVWKLSFEREYLFTGLFAFFVFAGYFAWIAIKLRFVDPFTPMIRM